MLQQAADLGEMASQVRRGVAVQRRRDEGAVQRQRAVQALFHQARDRQGDIAGQLLLVVQQPQVALADGQGRPGRGAGDGVGHLDLLADPAHLLVRIGRQAGVHRTRAADWEGQVDHRSAQVRGSLEGRRVVVVVRDVEGRAVGQDAGGARQRDHPSPQQGVVDLERGEAPAERRERLPGFPGQLLDVPLELLEMLGPEEHPLGPQNLALPMHGSDCCVPARSSSRNMPPRHVANPPLPGLISPSG